MKKVLALSFVSFVAPLSALAQDVFRPQTLPQGGPRSLGGFLGFFEVAADWLFTFLLVFAVIMILIAAFNYLFSGGSDEKIKSANRMLLYAAVAVAVGLLAQAVIFIIGNLVSPGAIRG
ncbi:MAG: hypothetical protein Q8P45_03565 [Candidatus Harrisonbacteria bacterium]|nr:hypothetical protein [Candidatus Harrisonbacteria bacterium]